MATSLRIASAQYPISRFSSFAHWQDHTERWVAHAVSQGAALLLWPEYASMELASLLERTRQRDLHAQLLALQDVLEDFRRCHRELAARHGVYSLPGTFPVRLPDGQYRNRAFLFGPEGEIGFQDKLQMTRFETEEWLISAGDAIHVLPTAFGPIGINICYDAEFPLLARAQVEAGARLLLVPSCTDTLSGYHRVRIGCQARALENQCFVVHAATVGEASWSPAVDTNHGAAAVYTPVDHGFPADGIAAIGTLDEPGWVFADVDLDAVATVRDTGQVFNFRDWDKQRRFL